jgi:hypothetical protein
LARARPLTVGTCKSGKQPYVGIGSDGRPTHAEGSFEIELWHILYGALVKTVQSGHGDQAARDIIVEAEPQFILFENDEELREALRRDEVDLGMCGLTVTNPAQSGFDFLPAHLETGLAFVVKDLTSSAKVDFLTVIGEILRPFLDVQAVMSMLILFGISMIVAHIFWALEFGSDAVFRDEYGPGIIDAFWFAIVTALTVGYGDKVPSTLASKFMAMIWMLMGAYLLSLFTASLTSSFVVKRLVPSEEIDISSIQDVVLYTAGTMHTNALSILLQHAPGVRMQRFNNHQNLFEAILDSSLQVGVLDVHVARYWCGFGGKYHKLLRLKGPAFGHRHIAFGVSRPGGEQHLLMDILRKSLVLLTEDSHGDDMAQQYRKLFPKHMRGEISYDQLHSGLGSDVGDLLHSEPGQVEEDASSVTDALLVEEFARLNSIGAIILGSFIALWSVSILFHYREEILEDRARQRFIQALGLQKRFTVHELRVAAGKLFDLTDSDRSGSLTQAEILGILKGVGKEVTFEDIKPYIEQELEEREEEEEARRREQEALLDEEIQLSGPTRAPSNALQVPSASNTRDLDPPSSSPAKSGRKSSVAGLMHVASELLESGFEDIGDDSDSEFENVLLTREEFVSVVEGFVMDHEEIQDQDDDLRQPAQRRHINTVAGDVQQQMHELEMSVQGSVHDIRSQINAVQRRLNAILETLPAAEDALQTQR